MHKRITTTVLRQETPMNPGGFGNTVGFVTRMTVNGVRAGGPFGIVLVAHRGAATLVAIR